MKQLRHVCHVVSNKLQNSTNVFSETSNLTYQITASNLFNIVYATDVK